MNATEEISKLGVQIPDRELSPELEKRILNFQLADIFKKENLDLAFYLLTGHEAFPYQLETCQRIIESCINQWGLLFVVLISRQAGKNECSSFIEMYLMLFGLYFGIEISINKFAPNTRPQVEVSKARLEGYLKDSILTKTNWKKELGYIYKIGEKSKTVLLSAHPAADVAGQTAKTLLEGDESQDLDELKWERDIAPMGAFNNATRVFWGVAWSKDSFNYKKLLEAQEMEKRTGKKQVLMFPWEVVAECNPFYKKYVTEEIARLGESHITILTQYKLQFLDTINKFFSDELIAKIFRNGEFGTLAGPRPGKTYVAGIDIAGEDEEKTDMDTKLGSSKKDSTVITIGEVQDDKTVVVVKWYSWIGKRHENQKVDAFNILSYWNVSKAVVDATGVGEPLASYLKDQLKDRVEPYKFKDQGDENKSKLGYEVWDFVNTGRLIIPQEQNVLPDDLEHWKECKHQINSLIRELKKEQQINYYVPKSSRRYDVPDHHGHDDYDFSLFLMVKAAKNLSIKSEIILFG